MGVNNGEVFLARINIEDELRADPRFHTVLCGLVPRNLAFGALVCLWDLGQAYWKKHELIPDEAATHLPNFIELEKAGFVVKKVLGGQFGWYCKGAKDRWGFLTARSEANRANGRRSAEARREKYGTAQPSNKPERNDDSFEQYPERNSEPPNLSGSGSGSGSGSDLVLFEEESNSSLRSELLPQRPKVRSGALPVFESDEICVQMLSTVTHRAQEAWLKTYPDTDWLGHELRKAYAWIESNPNRAPKLVAKFMANWFSRAYEAHRKNQSVNSTASTRNEAVLKDMARRVREGKL